MRVIILILLFICLRCSWPYAVTNYPIMYGAADRMYVIDYTHVAQTCKKCGTTHLVPWKMEDNKEMWKIEVPGSVVKGSVVLRVK